MTKQAVEGSSTGTDGETLILHRCEGAYPPDTPVGGRWKQYFHAEGFFTKSSDGIARLMSISTVRGVVGSTSLLNSDFLLCVSASGGTATITLPSISTSMGHQFAVVKIDSSANPVVITRAGSDTIEGATTKSLTTQYQAVWLDNNKVSLWHVLGERLAFSAGGGRLITSVATSTALDATHDVVLVTATATITLPTAVGIAGKTYCVKSNADAITVTIATTGGQTVDGVASGSDDIKLTQRYQSIDMISDGANWMILGRML